MKRRTIRRENPRTSATPASGPGNRPKRPGRDPAETPTARGWVPSAAATKSTVHAVRRTRQRGGTTTAERGRGPTGRSPPDRASPKRTAITRVGAPATGWVVVARECCKKRWTRATPQPMHVIGKGGWKGATPQREGKRGCCDGARGLSGRIILGGLSGMVLGELQKKRVRFPSASLLGFLRHSVKTLLPRIFRHDVSQFLAILRVCVMPHALIKVPAYSARHIKKHLQAVARLVQLAANFVPASLQLIRIYQC